MTLLSSPLPVCKMKPMLAGSLTSSLQTFTLYNKLHSYSIIQHRRENEGKVKLGFRARPCFLILKDVKEKSGL